MDFPETYKEFFKLLRKASKSERDKFIDFLINFKIVETSKC